MTMCWRCTCVAMGLDDRQADQLERGGLWIADYMRRCDIGFFEAAELVVIERRTLICAALARVAEREQVDDGEAYETLLAYGPRLPETIQ